MLAFSLLTIEDFCFFLIFPAIAVFSAHLSEGIKTLQSMRKERKTQKPSLISKEKVNKEPSQQLHWRCLQGGIIADYIGGARTLLASLVVLASGALSSRLVLFCPTFQAKSLLSVFSKSQRAGRRGSFPIWTCPSFLVLFCPLLFFLGLSRFFREFPDFFSDFPDWSFSSLSTNKFY